jgi:hypothetical protein
MEARQHLNGFARESFPALCSGNKPTWDAFVVAAVPLVNAAVGRVLTAAGQGSDAVSDAVHDVFQSLRADDFRLLKRYDASRASLSTWLAVIAWSCATNFVGCRGKDG